MRLVTVILPVGFILFLVTYIANNNMGVLNPKGIIAVAEKNLIITSVGLMMIVIIPVFIMLFSFAWRYRAGNKKAKYSPDWHTNTTLEIIWWSIPVVIISILGAITWKSTHDLDPFKPLVSNIKPITIQVVALDWKWLFIYPEENIATVNYIMIPRDTPINFQITSDAPMNAFWIPQLGSQIYAMAGMTAKLHLMAHEDGIYKGVSSNFSGAGFSGMKFDVVVSGSDEYNLWVQSARGSRNTLDHERYSMLAMQSKNNSVEYFQSVQEHLYDKIIMKYMMKSEHSSKVRDSVEKIMPQVNVSEMHMISH